MIDPAAAPDATMASGLHARRCSIYVFDPYTQLRSRPVARPSAETWSTHQHSTALWLHRSLQHHPWRVHLVEAADVIFIDADFSSLCRPVLRQSASKPTPFTSQRALWDQMLRQWSVIWQNHSVPKVVSRQQQACATPWGASRADDVLELFEAHRQLKGFSAGSVAPFVIASPRWLVAPTAHRRAEAATSRRGTWMSRQLLLFSGHVPKLYQSNVRYRLWRGLRRDGRVTTHSHSVSRCRASDLSCPL